MVPLYRTNNLLHVKNGYTEGRYETAKMPKELYRLIFQATSVTFVLISTIKRP